MHTSINAFRKSLEYSVPVGFDGLFKIIIFVDELKTSLNFFTPTCQSYSSNSIKRTMHPIDFGTSTNCWYPGTTQITSSPFSNKVFITNSLACKQPCAVVILSIVPLAFEPLITEVTRFLGTGFYRNLSYQAIPAVPAVAFVF